MAGVSALVAATIVLDLPFGSESAVVVAGWVCKCVNVLTASAMTVGDGGTLMCSVVTCVGVDVPTVELAELVEAAVCSGESWCLD